MRARHAVWFGFILLECCSICLGAPPASAPSGGGNGTLSGKSAWDASLWKDHCKHAYHLDVPDQPQAFPEESLLKDLNPEFATRLRAVIGVYQTASKLNDLGLTPKTGGIRTTSDQLAIYKKGRKLKDGAKGDKPGDWEVVDDGAIETKAWVSWHELGVAADLRQFVGDKLKQPEDTPKTKAFWSDTTRAMGDLGMIWGGFWPWDYGHLEWHPGVLSPDGIGTPGKAATDADLKYGYEWKLPQPIFEWEGMADSPGKSNQVLRVYTLVEKDNWICLEKDRFIEHQGEGYWRAMWRTFKPPVRLFPAYSPVSSLNLDSQEDSKWNSSSDVTLDLYDERKSNGKTLVEASRTIGKACYGTDLWVRDWQKIAIVGREISGYPARVEIPPGLKKQNPKQYEAVVKANEQAQEFEKKKRAEAMTRFAKVLKTSVYDIELHMTALREESSKGPVHSTGRRLGVDGYTEDWDNTSESVFEPPPIYLKFSWDRDSGAIGVGGIDALVDNDHPALEVRGAKCNDNGHCTLVSTRAPDSIKDLEHPLEWPTANPKPKPQPKKSQGFGLP